MPADADAETSAQMVFGGLSADRLGVRDAAFRRAVECEFLKDSLGDVIGLGDTDAAGEVVGLAEVLRPLRLPRAHTLGTYFLLATQNADGNWGDAEAEDSYERYRSTPTAVNSLRNWARPKRALVFPESPRSFGIGLAVGSELHLPRTPRRAGEPALARCYSEVSVP